MLSAVCKKFDGIEWNCSSVDISLLLLFFFNSSTCSCCRVQGHECDNAQRSCLHDDMLAAHNAHINHIQCNVLASVLPAHVLHT